MIRITYKIKVTEGKDKGKEFSYDFDLDELESDGLDSLVFAKGHWTSIGHGYDHYEIIGRELHMPLCYCH